MFKVLWIEDEVGIIEELCDESFNELFDEPIVPKSFNEACKYTENNLGYDFVIIDIDLTKFTDFNSKDVNEIKNKINFDKYKDDAGHEKNFGKSAGLFIFTKLLESGFPKERILFVTGNAGSKDNIYESFERHFNLALMSLPEYILKSAPNASGQLSKKLKSMITPYLTLRRGIIESSNCVLGWLNSDNQLEINSFINKVKSDLFYWNDVKVLWETLRNMLPLREPDPETEIKQTLYRHFLHELTHDFEKSFKFEGKPRDLQYCGIRIIKICRNMIRHSNLFEENIPEALLSYLVFMNFRAMFAYGFPSGPHEKILFHIFEIPNRGTASQFFISANEDGLRKQLESLIDPYNLSSNKPINKQQVDEKGDLKCHKDGKPKMHYFSALLIECTNRQEFVNKHRTELLHGVSAMYWGGLHPKVTDHEIDKKFNNLFCAWCFPNISL